MIKSSLAYSGDMGITPPTAVTFRQPAAADHSLCRNQTPKPPLINAFLSPAVHLNSMTTTLPHTPLIILGAGFSGIGAAIQAERLLSLTDYEIYDKSPSLGGTWALNTYRTYPTQRFCSRHISGAFFALQCLGMCVLTVAGCGVDIPSHFYSWSWSLNPNWTRQFVGQQEILECTLPCLCQSIYWLLRCLWMSSALADCRYER